MPIDKPLHNLKSYGGLENTRKRDEEHLDLIDFLRSEQGWRLASWLLKEYFTFSLIWWHISEVASCGRLETLPPSAWV